MNQVHLVVNEVSERGLEILCVCDTLEFAKEKAQEIEHRHHGGMQPYVIKFDVLEAPVMEDYRAWVYFGEKGIEYRVELCLSMPVAWDTFDPSLPYRDHHGSIVVKATSEDQALEKAKRVMYAYVNDIPITVKRMIPRGVINVGTDDSVS